MSKQYIGCEETATSITQIGVSTGLALGPLLFGVLFVFVHPYTAWFILAVFGAIASVILIKIGNKQSKKGRE